MPQSRKRSGKKSAAKPAKRLALTFDGVRLAARSLPGIEDSTSYGTPALKVRGKLLARLHQSGECFVLRADLLDREILMQADPKVFFITDHYRDYPWILVRFSAVDAGTLPELLERAWRLVAPKSLVQKYDRAASGAA
ncbi:MAG: MmcQ/YjbR family DNA-binding protein [Steroidobacteraceae bacterium]|jgi:hypothetical protein